MLTIGKGYDMGMIYELSDYENDMHEANEIYLRVIKGALICPTTGDIQILSPDELYELKKRALAIKAQFIGAAGKRLRQAVAVQLLDGLKFAGWDITPTAAVKVAKMLLGRAVNRKMLMDRYATPGRTAAQKADFTCLEELPTNTLYNSALDKLNRLLDEATKIRGHIFKDYEESEAYKLLRIAAGG